MKFHSWKDKGRWQRYASGSYYREDRCECGCVRRVSIDDEGLEVVESYTKDEVTQVAHMPCDRTRKRKGRKRKSRKGEKNMFSEFKEWDPPEEKEQKEDFIMITIPK